jgi:tetratricopeptide (TPR) repeat protein
VASPPSLRDLLREGRFKETLERYRELGAEPEGRRPEVQLLVATAATRLGDLGTGTSLADEALGQFRRRGDWDGSMRSLNLLGAIHWERGETTQAGTFFAEALRLAQELKDSLMLARACNNLASVAHLQGRFDEAAALYRGALLAYQRLGDRRGTAETYHNLGLAYWQAGDWSEGLDAADDAVRHAEVVGDRSLLALAIAGRAEIRVERGDVALAERELDRAQKLTGEAADEIVGAEVHRVRGLAALRRKHWEVALDHAEAAREVALQHDSVQLNAECSWIASRALRGLGRLEEAAQRRSEAEAGFQILGAFTLLERLRQESGDQKS